MLYIASILTRLLVQYKLFYVRLQYSSNFLHSAEKSLGCTKLELVEIFIKQIRELLC